MHNTVYLFEHEQIAFPWEDKDLRAIDNLNKATGADVIRATTYKGQRALQAKEFVGYFRFGKQSVSVLPKIYKVDEDQSINERAQQATSNLLNLLSLAGQIAIKEQAIAPLIKRKMDWFEILTRIFAIHLLEEWQLGVYRTYRSKETEETVLKGKWNISKQIRQPYRKHVFSVTYDDFTLDNLLNRVFRFVTERLLKITHDSENKRILGILRYWLDEVYCPNKLSVEETSQITLTRLNQRFEPLLNLARLFLDNSAIQLSVGDKSVFAFVFDMNVLYESFVANFIGRYREDILPFDLINCDLIPQARGTNKYLARQNNRNVFRVKPDIVFQDGMEFPLLIDTKYKRLEKSDTRLGVSQADFYQMYAYSKTYKSKRVILLYPQTSDMNSALRTQFNLDNTDQEIRVETLDIRVELGKAEGKQYLINQLRTILGETS